MRRVERGEDGLPIITAGFIGSPVTAPPRTPEHLVCMRGPCRHYFYRVTLAESGNPASTWEALGRQPPRQKIHLCLLDKEFDYDDDTVFECSKHDPMTVSEVAELRHRREQYEQHKRTEEKIDAEQR